MQFVVLCVYSLVILLLFVFLNRVDSSCVDLVTFCQFLFISLYGFFGIYSARPWRFPRFIPLRSSIRQSIVFSLLSIMNNKALDYRISLPLHMIFRSSSLVSNLLVGALFFSKRFLLLCCGRLSSPSFLLTSFSSYSSFLPFFLLSSLQCAQGSGEIKSTRRRRLLDPCVQAAAALVISFLLQARPSLAAFSRFSSAHMSQPLGCVVLVLWDSSLPHSSLLPFSLFLCFQPSSSFLFSYTLLSSWALRFYFLSFSVVPCLSVSLLSLSPAFQLYFVSVLGMCVGEWRNLHVNFRRCAPQSE